MSLGGVVLLVPIFIDLSHMFDHVRSLPAEGIHDAALLGFALAALIDLPIQPLLYGGARRAEARAPDPPGVPRARVQRSS